MPDFDALFAALTSWPYSFKYGDIARMTPRQLIELWGRLGRPGSGSAGGGDPSDETEAEADAPAPRKRKDFRDGYRCWDETVVEREMRKGGLDPGADPFAVARDVARDRAWAVMTEFCKKGMLQGQGVAKDDLAAARDLHDKTWHESDTAFERLRGCFLLAEAPGRTAFLELNRTHTYVSRWGKFPQDDEERAAAWYDEIRARHAVEFDRIRRGQ